MKNDIFKNIKSYAQRTIRNIDAKSGFINFDFILKKEKLFVLEFSIRPGGTGIPELIKAAIKKIFKLLIQFNEKDSIMEKKQVHQKNLFYLFTKSEKKWNNEKIKINNKYNKIIKILKVDYDYKYGQKVSKFKFGSHKWE